MGFENVVNALEDSWRMLAGTPLGITESDLHACDLPDAHYFAIAIFAGDGCERTVVLQVSTPLLITLTSAMFDERPDELSEEQCHDAGKELANILSSCCIQHLPSLENGEVGLPQLVTLAQVQEIERSGELAAHFLADHADDALSLSIIEPCHSK